MHIKVYSTSLVIKVLLKVKMIHIFSPIILERVKSLTKPKSSQDVGKLRLSCTVVGNENWYPFLEWSLSTEINFLLLRLLF